MSAKPALAFQPAPRPQPRTAPEDAERLLAATHDLGFGRASVAPAAAPQTPPQAVTQPQTTPSSAPRIPDGAAVLAEPAPSTSRNSEPARALDVRKAPALKFDLPEGVWDELRMAALRRRVTVKYLVLEALADRGYGVDLSEIPEDGRRLR